MSLNGSSVKSEQRCTDQQNVFEHESAPITSNDGQELDWLLSSRLDRINVKLDGGEQFEEGRSYIISDIHGNSRKMVFKSGEFVPSKMDMNNNKCTFLELPHEHLAQPLKGCLVEVEQRATDQHNAMEPEVTQNTSQHGRKVDSKRKIVNVRLKGDRNLEEGRIYVHRDLQGNIIQRTIFKIEAFHSLGQKKNNAEAVHHENEKLKEKLVCKICMEKDMCITFMPCRHLATCEDCAGTLTECPICRVPVEDKIHVYWS